MRNLGMVTEVGKQKEEKLLSPLDIVKKCGTMIEGPYNPYHNYRDTAKQRDSYYNTTRKTDE